MRISTSMMYGMGISGVQQHQQDLLRMQQQISSGRRMLTPSDDPVAAAAVLDLGQSRALNSQYFSNGDAAKAQLSLEEGALADVTMLLQDVKALAVNAGNATLTNADRAMIATELQNRYEELLAIANRGNGNGQYVFSGYQGATQPFAETSPGNVSYAGDDGQRNIQIGSSRTIPINDSGNVVFRSIRDGNGIFTVAPGAANSGSGISDPGNVVDPAKWNAQGNPRDFTIRFNVDTIVVPPSTTYDIVDNVNNVSLVTGATPGTGPYPRAYVAGAAISLKTQSPPDTNATPFDFGANLAVTGVPAGPDVGVIDTTLVSIAKCVVASVVPPSVMVRACRPPRSSGISTVVRSVPSPPTSQISE